MKALVAYSTRTKNTQKIGELIAEGIRSFGIEVDTVSVFNIEKAEDLERYDALAFGSATEGEDIMWGMEKMLKLAEGKFERKSRRCLRCIWLERRGPGENLCHHEEYLRDGHGQELS